MILPVRHHGHLVRQPLRLLYVVSGHQDRRAPRAQVVDQRPQLRADLRIEPDGRLVEQHQGRLVQQAAGQEQAAAHPARELVHRVLAPRLQARQVEPALDRGPHVLDAVQAGEHREVVLDGHVDVEVVELRHYAHLGPGGLGLARQLVAEHAQLTLVGDRLAGEQPHGRRLAGAVGTEQAEADAARHLEVQPVHGGDVAEPLDDTLQLDRSHPGEDRECPGVLRGTRLCDGVL